MQSTVKCMGVASELKNDVRLTIDVDPQSFCDLSTVLATNFICYLCQKEDFSVSNGIKLPKWRRPEAFDVNGGCFAFSIFSLVCTLNNFVVRSFVLMG